MTEHLTSLLIGIPILGALFLTFVPRQAVQTLRFGSVAVMLVELVLSFRLLE